MATAARGIADLTGWTPRAPLSGQRCLTRRAFELASPLAAGWGMEVGMTIDVLRAGLRVREVEIELRHRATGTDLAGQLHRAQPAARRHPRPRRPRCHGLRFARDAFGSLVKRLKR